MSDTQNALAAIAAHRHAVERWIKSSRDDRAAVWREVEAAWRTVKALRADTVASQTAAALMRQDGKLRSIA